MPCEICDKKRDKNDIIGLIFCLKRAKYGEKVLILRTSIILPAR